MIEANKVTVLYGKAGTSKTQIAVYTALNLFFTRQTEKVYILRPAVAMEDLGFMPGGVEEKLGFYFVPVKQSLYKMLDKAKVDKLFLDRDVEIVPVAFIQGITLDDVLICDEVENMTEKQIRMLLTRLGKGGKMILTGDTNQVMLKDPSKSGFSKLLSLCGQVEGFGCMELKTNYRDPFVEEVLKHY